MQRFRDQRRATSMHAQNHNPSAHNPLPVLEVAKKQMSNGTHEFSAAAVNKVQLLAHLVPLTIRAVIFS